MRKQVHGSDSTDRQSCVVDLVKEQGLTYKQTGELCGGISRQAVHQRYKRPVYSYHEKTKTKEMLRRYASVAFLSMLGHSAVTIAEEIERSRHHVYWVRRKYNLSSIGPALYNL